MMTGIKFEKVSTAQFKKDLVESFYHFNGEEKVKLKPTAFTDGADKLPKRATKCSAGYDFYFPINCTITLKPGETVLIPTGIRCRMPENVVLFLMPRSGQGFKCRLQLNNTVGVIDSDYYNADNEGHIMVKLTNDSNEGRELEFKQGDAICQGIFLNYLTTEDDYVEDVRKGGFGSTGR